MNGYAPCKCDAPKPWESNFGKKTNICKECGGKIEKVDDELGRLIIAFEAAARELRFNDAEERRAYVDAFVKGLPKRMKANLQTWRANRKKKDD